MMLPHRTRRQVLSLFLSILAIAFLIRPTIANPPSNAPITTGQRIFVAGHSFHFFIAQWLEAITQSANIHGHRTLGVQFIGGSRTIQHWDLPGARNKAKTAILTGNVDVLTLSPITIPDDGIEKFARLALAHNPNVRVTVQESWLPNDEPIEQVFPLKTHEQIDRNAATVEHLRQLHAPYFKELDEYVTDVNRRIGQPIVLVVPCGHALLKLREKIIAGQVPGISKQSDLFFDNLGHPKEPLQALVAYCHFAVIYRQSPVGLPTPHELTAAGYTNEKLNLLLQQIAWDAVTHEPLSGVSDSAPANARP